MSEPITISTTTISSEPILDNGQGVIDPDVYFQLNEAPADLPEFDAKLSAFVDYHKEKDNKVVFITVSISLSSIY
jgi:phosphopantothenate-cysteine ligase